MSEAATELGVTNHVIRRLIHDRVLAAEQVVPGAPYQIKASDLRDDRITAAIRRRTVSRPAAKRTSNFPSYSMRRGTMNVSS